MRVAASIAVTVLTATVLAGCQFVTPQQTARSYTPSDGVNGTAGDVAIRNVFLVDGTEDTASLIGVLANNGDSQTSVTLQWTSTAGPETRSVQVPAGGILSMTTDPSKLDTSVPGDSSAIVLDGVDATPGALFPVTFSTSGGQSSSLRLPVLTGSFSEYATLVPTPTPTPTPTRTKRTPSPDATDSLAPTPTPTDTLAG
ncbi:hypothetical protein GCM10009869_18010 [Amnibacterium kyonggiense]